MQFGILTLGLYHDSLFLHTLLVDLGALVQFPWETFTLRTEGFGVFVASGFTSCLSPPRITCWKHLICQMFVIFRFAAVFLHSQVCSILLLLICSLLKLSFFEIF